LLGELTASPWEYGYANLGHRLIYSRRSSLPPGVAVGTTLNLGDRDALAVRDYARAHPYEALSAQVWDFTTSTPAEAGEQPPVHAQAAGDSTGAASSAQASDSGMQQGADSAASTMLRSGKHGTEHDDTGGDSKRLHSESVDTQMPHGDVAPQTPQSEAGHDVIDDTPFENMMSPNKVAKYGDGPGSVNLLGQLRQIEHLDIEPEVALQEQDFDVMLQHELNLEEDPYEPISELSNRMKELSYPYSTHQLFEDGRMIFRIHPKHLDQLCKLLHLSKRLQNKRCPGHSEIETPDNTEALNQHDASVYRSCIGILLYLSPDLPQCQYVIRYLSTCASKPTHKAMVVLKPLFGYMAGHSDQYASLKWKGMHSGLLRDYECEEPVLEIFSDADWAADRNAADQCLAVQSSTEDAWCTHHQGLKRSCHCRAQNRKHMLPLQLSWMPCSLELRTILCWVLQVRILMYLYSDSSAARGVLSRRGVGRLRL